MHDIHYRNCKSHQKWSMNIRTKIYCEENNVKLQAIQVDQMYMIFPFPKLFQLCSHRLNQHNFTNWRTWIYVFDGSVLPWRVWHSPLCYLTSKSFSNSMKNANLIARFCIPTLSSQILHICNICILQISIAYCILHNIQIQI